MVCDDRLIEWDAPPRRSAPSIVDDRILTSCAVVCARMDGWWTLAAGNPHVTSVSSRKEELADGLGVLTPKPVLMDRSPDPPAAVAMGDRQTEGLGGLEVDHQLELRWPFHWQLAWVCSSKDSGDIIPCSTPRLVNACVTQGFPV